MKLTVPSLEARKNDIPILIKYFLEKYESKDRIFTEEAIEILQRYDWPGNIRELENLIRMLLVTEKVKQLKLTIYLKIFITKLNK